MRERKRGNVIEQGDRLAVLGLGASEFYRRREHMMDHMLIVDNGRIGWAELSIRNTSIPSPCVSL